LRRQFSAAHEYTTRTFHVDITIAGGIPWFSVDAMLSLSAATRSAVAQLRTRSVPADSRVLMRYSNRRPLSYQHVMIITLVGFALLVTGAGHIALPCCSPRGESRLLLLLLLWTPTLSFLLHTAGRLYMAWSTCALVHKLWQALQSRFSDSS
jgi:hypothetical protein